VAHYLAMAQAVARLVARQGLDTEVAGQELETAHQEMAGRAQPGFAL